MSFIDIRDHIKYLKFGYGRATDQLNIRIRAGYLTREDGLKLVKKIDGKVSENNIERFCKYVEITRDYYEILVERFVNKNLFTKTNDGWKMKIERV